MEPGPNCNSYLLNRKINLIELVQHGLMDAEGRVEAVYGAQAFVVQVGNRIELSSCESTGLFP